MAFGLVFNQPFIDGNKRSAWVAARLFLRLNHAMIVFEKAEAAVMMRRLAASKLTDAAVAAWFRDRLAGGN